MARLVLQEWSDKFQEILKENDITEKLRGIYVDDGRSVTKILKLGTRFDADEMKFDWSEKRMVADQNNYICAKKLTETEILRAMNSINVDLQFTSETENDFDKKRLPTLSFELWSTSDGLRHSYFEKKYALTNINDGQK